MFGSRYMPCQFCGESLDRNRPDLHHCVPERLADFQRFALREEIAGFGAAFRAFLDSPEGQFEMWLAKQQIRGRL